jgi:hypothetical protein
MDDYIYIYIIFCILAISKTFLADIILIIYFIQQQKKCKFFVFLTMAWLIYILCHS